MNALQELEQKTLLEGKEWTRRQLEEQMQQRARNTEPICPVSGNRLKNTRWRWMELKTVAGVVKVQVQHGYSQATGQWYCPVRVAWGLDPYQRVSPELEARACYTATETGSYERAAKMAKCWGTDLSDDLVHRHVQTDGHKAQELILPNKEMLPSEPEFSLVIMMDGWMVRERGPDWGASLRKRQAQRIQWHEIKSAVIFRLEQRVQTDTERTILVEKFVEACPPMTSPVDFGKAVQLQAMRRGLAQAKKVYVVIDGAIVLWEIAEDRFKEAIKTLDFHHVSQHLWAVAHALYGEGTQQAQDWAQWLLHQLRHGQEMRVIEKLEHLLQEDRSPPEQAIIERETAYFKKHQDHMHYQKRWREGAPIGSGAVESLACQFQRRFKTCGQFWSRKGLAHLLRISVLFKNQDQQYIWN